MLGLVAGALVALGCGAREAKDGDLPLPVATGAPAPRTASVNVQALGEQVVKALAAGEHEAVASRFDETMAAAMTARQLGELWAGLQAQVGDYQGIERVKVAERDGVALAIVTTTFAKARLDVRVVVAGDGKIAGLFVRPADTDAESWDPPSYAALDSIAEEPMSFGSEPYVLPGSLTKPRDAASCPGLVLVHGSGPNDRDESVGPNKPFRDLALGLASRGVCVLRYDKRTKVHGEALIGALGDDLTLVEETIDDAVAAAAWLRARPEVSGVFVLGHSLGGTALPRIAAADPTIAGLVIFAGSSRPLEDVVFDQLSYISKLDGSLSPQERALLDRMSQQVSRVKALDAGDVETTPDQLPLGIPAAYWRDLAAHRPAEALAKETRPVLVMHAGRDYQVTDADYAGWQRALEGKPNATLTRYPDLNHLFIAGEGPSAPPEYLVPGHVSPQVIVDLATWLTK